MVNDSGLLLAGEIGTRESRLPATNALISDELQQRDNDLAREQNRELSEVVEEAVGKYLASQRMKETFAFGAANARRNGIKPEDVDVIVREERDKTTLGR